MAILSKCNIMQAQDQDKYINAYISWTSQIYSNKSYYTVTRVFAISKYKAQIYEEVHHYD